MSDPNQVAGYLSYKDSSGQVQYLDFDAFVTEQHGTSAEITQHPAEKGIKFTDHIRPNPDTLSIEAWVTNTPIYERKLSGGTKGEVQREFIGTEGRSVPFGVPFPIVQDIEVTGFQAMDRCRAVYTKVLDLCKNSTPVSCVTELRAYSSMAIASVSVPVDAGAAPGNAIKFNIELRELRIVSTKTTKGTATEKAAIDHPSVKTSKGNKDAKEVKGEERSTLGLGTKALGIGQ